MKYIISFVDKFYMDLYFSLMLLLFWQSLAQEKFLASYIWQKNDFLMK